MKGQIQKYTYRKIRWIRKIVAIIMVMVLLPFSDMADLIHMGNGVDAYGENSDIDIIPDNWVITEDYQLTRDVQVSELTIQNGTLDLNGYKLMVSGNVVVDGRLRFGYGSLYCGGDLILEEHARCSMRNVDDYLEIQGNFEDRAYEREQRITFQYGKIKVYGDYTSFYGVDYGQDFTIEFCGEEIQEIMAKNSLGKVVSNNLSEEGIRFIDCKTYTNDIVEGCTVTHIAWKDRTMEDWTLESDETMYSDLSVGSSALDLNGHTLTVYGNLYVSDGKININHGNLIIKGELETGYDAYVDDKKTMVSGQILMENEEDYIEVEKGIQIISDGNLVFESGTIKNQGDLSIKGDVFFGCDITSKICMNSDGIIQIAGQFEVEKYQHGTGAGIELRHGKFIDYGAFETYGIWTDCGLKMSHEDDYVCFYEEPDLNTFSYGDYRITNGVVEVKYSKAELDYPQDVTVILSGNKPQNISGTASKVIVRNHYLSDVYFSSLDCDNIIYEEEPDSRFQETELSNGGVLEGNKFITGDFTLMSGDLDLNGYTLFVSENLYHFGGKIKINGGKLIVGKDYERFGYDDGVYWDEEVGEYIEKSTYIIMENSDDYVQILGNYKDNHYAYQCFSNGTLEVKGNIQGDLYTYNEHKVIMSGSDRQEFIFDKYVEDYYVILASLEVQNTSEEGVYINESCQITTLVTNGNKITYPDKSVEWILNQDTVIEDDVVLYGGKVDVNGYTLTIRGDFFQKGGELLLNGGTVVIEGDYSTPDDSYRNNKYVKLVMGEECDRIEVKGNLIINGNDHIKYNLSKGRIIVGLDIRGTLSMSADTNQSTVFELNGKGKQGIYPYKNKTIELHRLVVNNTSEIPVSSSYDVIILDELNINHGSLDKIGVYHDTRFDTTNYIGSIRYLTAHTSDTCQNISGNLDVNGNLEVNDTLTIQGDVTVTGDLIINGILNVNGNVNVTGNIMQKGNVNIGGNLYVTGDFTQQKSINVDGNTEIRGNTIIEKSSTFTSAYLSCSKMEIQNDAVIKVGELKAGGRINLKGSLEVKDKAAIYGMLDVSGVINIGGDIEFLSYGNLIMNSDEAELSAQRFIYNSKWDNVISSGNIYVSGDMIIKNTGRLEIDGNCILNMTGTDAHFISSMTENRFKTLNIINESLELYISNNIHVENITDNGATIIYTNDALVLSEDTVIDGDMGVTSGSLNLNGYKLTVKGNFREFGGNIVTGDGGTLEVEGNFYGKSTEVNELGESGKINIKGDIYAISQFTISGGETKIWGDIHGEYKILESNLTVNGTLILAADTLNHNTEVTITADNLIVESTGINNKITFYVNDSVTMENLKDDNKVYLFVPSLNVIANEKEINVSHVICASENQDDFRCEKDMDIHGELMIENTMIVGTHDIKADKIHIDGGLIMNEEEGYVQSRNGLYFYANNNQEGMLTAGTIEVFGDLCCNGNYVSTNNHRTKLGRPDVTDTEKAYHQKLYAYDNQQMPTFATLVLTRRIDSSSYNLPRDIDKYCHQIIYEYSDMTPPKMLGDINVVSKQMQGITLSFPKATDNYEVMGYHIYRDGELIADIKGTNYTDTGLMPGISYGYMVEAYDDCNNVSEKLILDAVTLPDIEAPSKVTGLTVSKRSGNSITIRWNASIDNTEVKGYNIYRNGEKIKECVNTTQYKDANLEKNTVYEYMVEAVDLADNVSEQSEEISSYTCMPEINTVTPTDGSTIGGKSVPIEIYVTDNGNQSSYNAKIEYRRNTRDWIFIEDNIRIDVRSVSINQGIMGRYEWDVSKFSMDGEYDIRITVTDEDGNSTSKILTYSYDKTPPLLPEDITGTCDNGVNIIKYSASKSADCAGYVIYRKSENDEMPVRYASIEGRYVTKYQDINVKAEMTYEYVISAYDKMGNESDISESIIIDTTKDRETPKVTGIYPTERKINGITNIQVFATDNISVSSIKLWYQKEDSGNEESATLIQEKEALDNQASFDFDTQTLEDGNYVIYATAVDGAGNESECSTYGKSYEIDNTGIEKIILAECKADATNIQLKWEDVKDEDFSYFIVEQVEIEVDTNGKESVHIVQTMNAGNVLGYTITGLMPEQSYHYRVVGYDILNNRGEPSDIITIQTAEDHTKPTINHILPVQSKYRDCLALSMNVSDNCNVIKGEFAYSLDGENFTEVGVVNDNNISRNKTFSHTMDLTGIPDGKLYIRFIAYDEAGNRSALMEGEKEVIATYVVDREAPEAPANPFALGDNGAIRLSWDAAGENDVQFYRINRSEEENGEYSICADKVDRVCYDDIDVMPGKCYFYKIVAVDIAGNESEMSDVISAKAVKDTEVPRILALSPDNDITIGKNGYIKVAATDNTRIDEIHVEYRNAQNEQDIYRELAYKNCNMQSDILEVSVKDTPLTEGTYDIRAYAKDISGNVSEYKENRIHVKATPPDSPTLICESGGYKVTLKMEDISTEDIINIKIYRAELLKGQYSCIAGISQPENKQEIYVDKTAKPGIMYCYKVEVIDEYDNRQMSKVTIAYATDEDTDAPTAILGETITTIEGYEIALDGGASADNVRVTEYIWNMGNGDMIYGVSPTYTYSEEGVYTVKLTVKDAAGNSNSTNMSVIVLSNEDSGKGTVHVTDNEGIALAYADVYVRRDDGSTLNMKTDGRGDIIIADKEGTYEIAVYAAGYLPSETNIQISRYKETEKSIVMEKGDVVVGELKVERMSLQEIIDAGVDLSNVDNLNSFTVSAVIKLEKRPIPVQVEYIFTDSHTEAEVKNSGNSSCEDETDEPHEGYYKSEVPKIVAIEKEKPIFAYIHTDCSISWLKDMYDVSLTILNAAESSFTLEDCQAKLHLPDGVSLAVTKEGQTLRKNMGNISGQQQKTVSWVIKGDKSGAYKLSADFNGTLMPFERSITGHFETEEEFEVKSIGKGIHIFIDAEDAAYIGEEYYVDYRIKNESTEPIYNFSSSLDAPVGQVACVYTVNSGTEQTPVLQENDIICIPVLAPGESVFATKKYGFVAEGDPEKEYYQAIEAMVTSTQTTNQGVKVSFGFKNSHGARTIVKYEEFPIHTGDPIDLTTGAFTDSIPVMEVSGVSVLDYTLDYNSGINDSVGENGYGFYHNYETYIEDNGCIKELHLANGISGTFIQSDSLEKNYSGRVNENEIYLDKGNAYGAYTSITATTKDYYLNKNQDGTYTVITPAKDIYTYDEQGRNVKIVSDTCKTVLMEYRDKQKIIIDEATGNRLKLTYNDAGKVIAVSDDTGRIAKFAYDGDRLMSYTNVLGETTTFTYDAENRILTETDCEGVTYVTNTYDEKGRVIEQRDADNTKQPLTITYEEKDSITLIKVKDALGNVGTMAVDYNGRVLSQTNAKGSTTTMGYDSNGNQVMERDALGGTVQSIYDEQGRKTAVIDQNGNKITFNYDSRDNLTAVTDGKGNTSTYIYDERNLLIRVTDYGGAVTSYEYNEDGQVIKESKNNLGSRTYKYTNGRLTETTDYNGNITRMEYDDRGCIIRLTDALGNVTSYTYDAMLRETSETNALGEKKTYTYDKYGNIETETDESGRNIRYEYNISGQKSAEILPDGSRTTYEYDALGNVIKVSSPDGTSTVYTYDSEGNLLSETNEVGETITYEYDLLNRKTSETNTSGETITYKYYGNGKPSEKIYPDGTRELYTYDKNWNLLRLTDTRGSSTTYAYDNADRVVEERDAYGNTMSYAYDINGRLKQTIDKRGNETRYAYDNEGNCVWVKTPDSTTVTYEYDALNRTVSKSVYTEENGEITVHYEYDALSRLTRITDEEGGTITYAYDSVGNIVRETDQMGNSTTYEYDILSQLIKKTNPLGITTVNEYNKAGLLIKENKYVGTDKEVTYTYGYDKTGRMVSATDPLEGTTACTYDKDGNTTSMTDANGGTTIYTYDNMCRLTASTNAIGATNTYTYNAKGLLEESKNARGDKTTYEYDRLGRITKATDKAGIITYEYDANNNVTKVREEKADGRIETITRNYDVMNRVTAVTDSNGNTIRYGYDELGNIRTITYPGGEKIRYSYYASGRMKSVTDSKGRVTYYNYDATGNIISIKRPDGSMETNSYDAMGQLTGKTDKTARGTIIARYRYEYDERGNIIRTTEENGKGTTGETLTDKTALELAMMTEELRGKQTDARAGSNEMNVTTLNMKYDEANRLISYNGKTVRYDKDGNMTYGPVDGKMTKLEYDCRNRLIKAGNTSYEYNAENTRTAVIQDNTRTEYITDTNSTLSQVLETKTIKEDGSIKKTTYIYGNGLLYEENAGYIKIHHYDNIGSTTALTDTKGNILANYTYGTYGELLSGDTTQTSYLYNGQFGVETDKNNLYFMRARYYNVNIKRFINQDIVTGNLANSQSLNRYSYVQGNPVSLTDPFGLSPMAGINWKTIGHAILNGLGMIPGIGDAFDLVNAVWYLADGDYKNALLSGISALPMLGDTIGAGMNIMGATKAAKLVKTASRAISYGATCVQATGGTVNGIKDVCKNIKDGQIFSKQNAMDMAGLVINTFTALCSGKAAYKYGLETGKIAKATVSDTWSSVKGKAKNVGSAVKSHLTEFHQNNGGYLNLGEGGSKTYQTYTKTNPVTGEVYSGRTSGTGTPAENVRKRDANHHMNDKGFGPAVLDKTTDNYEAIRGREQMLIDYHGGAQSMGGTSGNAINGIGPNNEKKDIYINAAKGEFGDIE